MCFIGVTSFVSTQGKIFLVSVVIFCLLDSMVVLQVKQFFGLQLQWFLILHFFEGMLTWLVVGLLERSVLEVQFPHKCLCLLQYCCKLHMHFKLIMINLLGHLCFCNFF
jgi:hypothetical protein